MRVLLLLKILIRWMKAGARHWLIHQQVLYKNPGVFIPASVVLQCDNPDAIRIASEVSLGDFSEIVVRSESSYSSIPGELIIESRAVIGSHANIRAGGGKVFIGKNVLIAQHVSLIASNHMMLNHKPYRDLPWDESKTGVYIEENAWIGAGAVILPGCVVGKNSVVGAGSVVTKSVPANEIWAGVPARKIREICSFSPQEYSNVQSA